MCFSDRFDPLGLAKPGEFLQIDLDELDQNKAVNKAGKQIGKVAPKQVKLSSNSLQPYDEVFGLQRFRECELIHGRWAMLATLGAIIGKTKIPSNCKSLGLSHNLKHYGFTLRSKQFFIWCHQSQSMSFFPSISRLICPSQDCSSLLF